MPGPQRTIRRDDVMEVMRDRVDPREPWTVKEIAEVLGCGESTVYKRLRELKTQGRVRTKAVGSSARVWWPAEPTDADIKEPGAPA